MTRTFELERLCYLWYGTLNDSVCRVVEVKRKEAGKQRPIGGRKLRHFHGGTAASRYCSNQRLQGEDHGEVPWASIRNSLTSPVDRGKEGETSRYAHDDETNTLGLVVDTKVPCFCRQGGQLLWVDLGRQPLWKTLSADNGALHAVHGLE